MRKTSLILAAIGAVLLAPLSLRAPQAQTSEPVAASLAARVIVKYASGSNERERIQAAARPLTMEQAAAQRATRAQALSGALGIPLQAGIAVAEATDVVMASGISSTELAQRIEAQPGVVYAIPDQRRRRAAVPNDPLFAGRPFNSASNPTSGGPVVGQWYLKVPGPATANPTAMTSNTAPAAINAVSAWDITTGAPTVVIAVLDTGIRFDHEDFREVANGGNLLKGYDMVSGDSDGTFTTANDGDGRDADASDPGDFVLAADNNKGGCTSKDVGDTSSWHGTEMAAVIGAVTNNSIGIASVGRNVRVLPVRVLGKCGGYDSDIIAGIRWAAGLAVPGVPANADRARVVNLSLGGVGNCSAAYADAIAQVRAVGTVVVSSAGNSAGRAVSTPANCSGVIAVAGVRHIGTKVGFSDIGPQITISAPGGNCINTSAGSPCIYPIMSASNKGTTTR
jgi:serine protease